MFRHILSTIIYLSGLETTTTKGSIDQLENLVSQLLEFIAEEYDRHQMVNTVEMPTSASLSSHGVQESRLKTMASMPQSKLFVSLIDNQQQSFPLPQLLTLSIAIKFQQQQIFHQEINLQK